jgi:hypothetical protein
VIAPTLLAAALAACTLPAPRAGSTPWKPGERLAFDLDVMGMVKAGTVALSAEPPVSKGGPMPIKAHVRNTSIFAKIRRVNAVAISWLAPKTLRPERYREEGYENEVHKITDARIGDHAQKPHVALSVQIGKMKKTETFPRQGELLDLVSAMYYFRAADIKPGQKICFDLVGNRKLWRVTGEMAPKIEKVDTPAGTFETVRLDGVGFRADKPDSKRVIHIWFSTDARHLPVAAVSEIDLGPVRAILSRIGGAPAGGAGDQPSE